MVGQMGVFSMFSKVFSGMDQIGSSHDKSVIIIFYGWSHGQADV